jgi:methylmalonyl-CoA mutase C-terminal domain/subunit
MTTATKVRPEAEQEEGPQRKIRVLLAKAGLDGHDRGVKVIARALRDGGMEVIYTGLHNTPEQVVRAALQEDVDVIGVSILSGAHMTIFPRILELMKQHGMDDVVLIGGGIIPDDDKEKLKQMGVREIFGPGASLNEIVEFIRREVQKG